MGTPIDKDQATKKLDTVEVYVPGAKETRINFLQFTPLVVAIITLLNMVYTSITGNSLLGITDEELASYVNLIISTIAIGFTAYKNLNITKGGRAREEVAKQAIPDKKEYKQQNK